MRNKASAPCLRPLGHILQGWQQRPRIATQYLGHLEQDQDTNVDQASLDHAPVAAVQACLGGERFLRITGLFARLAQGLADELERRLHRPADVSPFLLDG